MVVNSARVLVAQSLHVILQAPVLVLVRGQHAVELLDGAFRAVQHLLEEERLLSTALYRAFIFSSVLDVHVRTTRTFFTAVAALGSWLIAHPLQKRRLMLRLFLRLLKSRTLLTFLLFCQDCVSALTCRRM
jgi:hypothetical protein